jgi:hypothetical protein
MYNGSVRLRCNAARICTSLTAPALKFASKYSQRHPFPETVRSQMLCALFATLLTRFRLARSLAGILCRRVAVIDSDDAQSTALPSLKVWGWLPLRRRLGLCHHLAHRQKLTRECVTYVSNTHIAASQLRLPSTGTAPLTRSPCPCQTGCPS